MGSKAPSGVNLVNDYFEWTMNQKGQCQNLKTCISYFLRKSAGNWRGLIGAVQILKTRPDGTGFETSSVVQLLSPLGVPYKCAAVISKMHR